MIVPFSKTVTAYRTSDGREWNSREEAQEHELILEAYENGTRRKCTHCDGMGRVNIHLVKHGGADFAGYSEDELWWEESEKCPICKGKGYLERKEIWE